MKGAFSGTAFAIQAHACIQEISKIMEKQREREKIPVTLVEHMTDPRAAQLQMLFASMDERGKKTLLAMAGVMVKLQKGEGQ